MSRWPPTFGVTRETLRRVNVTAKSRRIPGRVVQRGRGKPRSGDADVEPRKGLLAAPSAYRDATWSSECADGGLWLFGGSPCALLRETPLWPCNSLTPVALPRTGCRAPPPRARATTVSDSLTCADGSFCHVRPRASRHPTRRGHLAKTMGCGGSNRRGRGISGRATRLPRDLEGEATLRLTPEGFSATSCAYWSISGARRTKL